MPRPLTKNEQKSNVEFVLEVEKYPCLYNYHLDDYSKRDVVDAAWVKIAQSSRDTVRNCKDRWKNLRTVFVRKRKQPPSESNRRKLYYLNDAMQFINPFIKFQGNDDSPSNLSEENPPILSCVYEETKESSGGEFFSHDRETEDEEMCCTLLSKNIKSIAKRSCEKRKSTACDVFMEYILEKKKRMNKQPESNRRAFILSLMPDIENMTDSEFHSFRRLYLDAIDNSKIPANNSTPIFIATSTSTFSSKPPYSENLPQASNQENSTLDNFKK
ncbi:hypothetical protein CHUAL_006388 [Chamberlinius hualienensis]